MQTYLLGLDLVAVDRLVPWHTNETITEKSNGLYVKGEDPFSVQVDTGERLRHTSSTASTSGFPVRAASFCTLGRSSLTPPLSVGPWKKNSVEGARGYQAKSFTGHVERLLRFVMRSMVNF